jgi:hypothetical protein
VLPQSIPDTNLNNADAEFESGNEDAQLNVSQDFENQDFELEKPASYVANDEGMIGGEADDDEEGESVYMIDNVVMQKIQIEGEPD